MANEQTIANLIVKLSAQTVELSSGLKKAEGMIGNFKTAAVRLLGGLSMVGIATGLAKGIRDAQQYAAQMSVLAEKTNTNIEIISSLADAADDLGVSAESLANGIKFLGNSAFEATNGAGKQREAFKALGVEYESMPGVVRPTLDILLDLSDALKNMEGDARRNPLAMALMSRGFMDMIPLMTKGRQVLIDWMATSKDAGKVIDAYTGKAARQFNADVSNLKDNIQGLALSIMGDLLPAMRSGVQSLIAWTTGLKEYHVTFSLVMDAIKSAAIVAIPFAAAKLISLVGSLAVVKQAMDSILFTKAIGGFSSLGLAVANAGFIIKQFAVGVMGPMLLNPITLVVAALAGLTFAWLRLSKATAEAKIEHEKYFAAVTSMDLGTVQAEIAKYQAYLNTLAEFIKKKNEELEKETTAFGQATIAMAIDRVMKFQTDAVARLDALKKQAEKIKTPSAVSDNTQVMDKITAKTKEYESALAGLVNPAAGARAAVKAFEDELRATAAFSPSMEQALNKMWAAFNRLQSATEKKALGEAIDKKEFSATVQAVEADMQRLEMDYQAGLVTLDDYHQRRMSAIRKQAAAEVALLQKQKLPGLPESKKTEIDTAVSEKQAAGELKITGEVERQTEAYRKLRAEQMAGSLAAALDDNATAVVSITNRYEDGLITVKEYYAERKRLSKEASDAEIAAEEKTLALAKSEDKPVAINRIAALRRKAAADNNALNREEVLSTLDSINKKFSLEMAFLDIRREKINDDLAVGIGNQATAEAAIIAIEKERIPILQKMADEAKRLADESGRPELVQQAEALSAAVRKLSISTDKSGQDLAKLKQGAHDALVDGFANFLSRGIREAKNFGDAIKGMAAAFAQAMADMIARMIAFAAVSAMFKALGVQMPSTGMKDGGSVQSKAEGGPIRGPGTGTSDSILAWLSNGEYVVREKAVRHYGVSALEAINRVILPKGMFSDTPGLTPRHPGFAFATGGLAQGGGGGGTTTLDSSLTVGLSPGLTLKELDTPAGQRVLIRILEKNKRSVRSAIGG